MRALPFNWEGVTVAVLERGGAVGGGVGAFAEVFDDDDDDDDDDDGAGLLTLGLLSFSFSLPCEGLWLGPPDSLFDVPFPRELAAPRPVCLTVALKAGRHT